MNTPENKQFKSKRNTVSQEGHRVIKFFDSPQDFAVESLIYDKLSTTSLAPKMIEKKQLCIITEFIEGELFFDCLEQALGDLPKQRYLFDLFFSWCKNFYKKTGYTLGDTNFRNFILQGKTLYGIDFESCRQGSMAEDVAWQSAMLATLRPEYSKERLASTRLFLSMACNQLNIASQDVAAAVPSAFKKICERRKVEFNELAIKEILSTLEVAACVLAGGASSRMGQDKRQMAFRDGTLFSNALHSVSLFSDKYVSLSKESISFIPEFYKTVQDAKPDLGPLSGIASAFDSITAPWTLIIPCDMPFLKPEILDYLLCFRQEAFDAVLFREMQSTRMFPMLLQTETTRPIFQEALDKGSLALWRLLKEKLRVQQIPVEACPDYKAYSLKNINTQEEYETLSAICD